MPATEAVGGADLEAEPIVIAAATTKYRIAGQSQKCVRDAMSASTAPHCGRLFCPLASWRCGVAVGPEGVVPVRKSTRAEARRGCDHGRRQTRRTSRRDQGMAR